MPDDILGAVPTNPDLAKGLQLRSVEVKEGGMKGLPWQQMPVLISSFGIQKLWYLHEQEVRSADHTHVVSMCRNTYA